MNADGIITDWNPRAETTFGWSKDEAVGRAVALYEAKRRGRDRTLSAS